MSLILAFKSIKFEKPGAKLEVRTLNMYIPINQSFCVGHILPSDLLFCTRLTKFDALKGYNQTLEVSVTFG